MMLTFLQHWINPGWTSPLAGCHPISGERLLFGCSILVFLQENSYSIKDVHKRALLLVCFQIRARPCSCSNHLHSVPRSKWSWSCFQGFCAPQPRPRGSTAQTWACSTKLYRESWIPGCTGLFWPGSLHFPCFHHLQRVSIFHSCFASLHIAE